MCFGGKKELGAKCRKGKNSINQSEPKKIFALSISRKKAIDSSRPSNLQLNSAHFKFACVSSSLSTLIFC